MVEDFLVDVLSEADLGLVAGVFGLKDDVCPVTYKSIENKLNFIFFSKMNWKRIKMNKTEEFYFDSGSKWSNPSKKIKSYWDRIDLI